MSEERLARLAEELLGPPAAMLAFSKSGYQAQHPDHLVVFYANVWVGAVVCWSGDLDLTLSEPQLQRLADRAGEPVAVLYDSEHFTHETGPLLDGAILGLTPNGQARYDDALLIRGADGSLRRRPTPPLPPGPIIPADWDGSRRPRLLRFRKLRRRYSGQRRGRGFERGRLLYIGAGGATPLLVLGCFHFRVRQPELGVEVTWYPSRRPYRRQPLYQINPSWRPGQLRPSFYLVIWPGFVYTVQLWLPYRRHP